MFTHPEARRAGGVSNEMVACPGAYRRSSRPVIKAQGLCGVLHFGDASSYFDLSSVSCFVLSDEAGVNPWVPQTSVWNSDAGRRDKSTK